MFGPKVDKDLYDAALRKILLLENKIAEDDKLQMLAAKKILEYQKRVAADEKVYRNSLTNWEANFNSAHTRWKKAVAQYVILRGAHEAIIKDGMMLVAHELSEKALADCAALDQPPKAETKA
jgi:hypothetical protein